MTQYIVVEAATGRISHAIGRPDPQDFAGTPDQQPFPHDGLIYYGWQERIAFSDGPTPSSELRWTGDAPAWVELADLPAIQTRLIAEVDQVADAARLAVVGDAARIKEYERAQLHAEQYRDSGWTLVPVPSSVASWAAAKAWTERQACDDILAASARWYAALDAIRALRLKAKEDIRSAATNTDAGTIFAAFQQTLGSAMQGVQ